MAEQEMNKDAPQPAGAVLPEDKEVGEVTYHSRYPGSNIILADGRVVEFNGKGELTTKSKNVQDFMKGIADKGGSPIYTKDAPVLTKADTQPQEDIKTRAAQVSEQLRKLQNQQTGG